VADGSYGPAGLGTQARSKPAPSQHKDADSILSLPDVGVTELRLIK